MIKVVIFDFDGVLVDSNELWVEIFNRASVASGIKKKFSYDDIKPHYGKPLVDVLKSAHPRFKHDDNVLEVMYNNFLGFASKEDFVDSFRTFSGMKGTLSKLKQHYKLAVGSGNGRKLLLRFLEKLGIMDYFDMVVSGNDVDNGKPSPDMLLKIIDHFGVKPGEAVYVGDSESDIMAAKNAKTVSVAVLTGALDKEQAKELKPDYIIKDATHLPEVLECM